MKLPQKLSVEDVRRINEKKNDIQLQKQVAQMLWQECQI